MTRLLYTLAATVVLATLSGCMSVSGLDAKSSFSCQAPDGVLCESMSGIYANAEQHNLPGQRVHHTPSSAKALAISTVQDPVVLTRPVDSGTPLRSAPRVLRLWFAPWEDNDGDLHDQSYVYLVMDSGQWLIEHQRRRIQDNYQPVYMPAHLPVSASAQALSAASPASSEATETLSGVRAEPEQGMAFIDGVQNRPSAQEAAAMMGNIQLPVQPGQSGQP